MKTTLKKNNPVSVLLDDQMLAALERAAKRKDRTKSWMIGDALNRAIPAWAEESDAVTEELVHRLMGQRKIEGVPGEIGIEKDGDNDAITGLTAEKIAYFKTH